MKVAILGTMFLVSFPEITDHSDSIRVLQCILKDEKGHVVKQAVSTCNDRNRFNKVAHEKVALKGLLAKILPNPADNTSKESIRNERRKVWQTYLVSSTKRRKLVPGLEKAMSNTEQSH